MVKQKLVWQADNVFPRRNKRYRLLDAHSIGINEGETRKSSHFSLHRPTCPGTWGQSYLVTMGAGNIGWANQSFLQQTSG